MVGLEDPARPLEDAVPLRVLGLAEFSPVCMVSSGFLTGSRFSLGGVFGVRGSGGVFGFFGSSGSWFPLVNGAPFSGS